MTLTVPRAGSIAGAVPNIQVDAPTIGADVARFGNVMADVGLRLKKEQEGRMAQRATLDYTRGLNDLDLDLRNSGDPDLIDSMFPDRAAALRAKILGGLPIGDNPGLMEDLDLRLGALEETRRASLGQHALNLRQAQSRVLLGDLQNEFVRSAVNLDADGRFGQLEQFAITVQERVQSGILSPEQGAKLVLDTQSAMDTATARALLRDNPEGLVAALEAGDLFSFDEGDRQTWLTRTQSAIETVSEREGRELDRRITADLQDATKILKAGQTPERLDEFTSSEVYLSHPAAEDFGRALFLAENRPDFMRAPPARMRDMLAEEEARPKGSAGELDISSTMREVLEQAEREWARDPIAHSAAIGLGDPPALPDNPAAVAPEELAQALAARGHYAASLAGNADTPGWVERENVRLFTDAERDQFKPLVDPSAPPPERARVAAAFAKAFGDEAPARLRELEAEPVFDFVGGLLAHGGSERLAREVFEGQRAIANKDVPLPAQPQRRQAWFTEFNGLFDNEFEDGMRDQVIGAADALYAYRARGNPDRSDGRLSETEYLQSAHEVLGGTGKFNERTARGGVQVVNNIPTLLPPDVRGTDVKNAITSLARELDFADINTPLLESIDDTANNILREISATDTAPSFGGQRIDAYTLRQSGLRAVGDGTYALIYQHPDLGQTTALDENGDLFLLDLRRLLERGAR